jgi:lipoprotein-anchoring transpeptidase ErfK/SrfK
MLEESCVMKSPALLPLVLSLSLAAFIAAPAKADPGAVAPGSLGGGFIELLMTGRDPTPGMQGAPMPRMRGRMNSPAAIYAEPPEGDAYRPARPQRMAILPSPDQVPAMSYDVPERFKRQMVDYDSKEKPGTIVIDTRNKYLYLVEGDGKALRYGIGVGREGFVWHGTQMVSRKREWPDWTPPAEMLKRRPDLPRHMEGGPANPLGARAMYLGSSLYRIHGTNEPNTIGHNVSSGCIRLTNEDVMDLYNRVRIGAKVVAI